MNDKFSRIGFILAVAGSAVGLGNAWKFPTLVGQNGGSAFVCLYLLLTLCVGFVIFLAELSIGKLSGKDPVNAYKALSSEKSSWKFVGFSMLGAILIVSFYSIIIGWTVYYVYLSFFSLPSDIQSSKIVFENLLTNGLFSQFISFSIVFVCIFLVVSRGVKNGIEKLNVWMMPTLFIILVLMLIYSFTMNGFMDAFKFLFLPDFSKLGVSAVLQALGLAFFSLSIGAGSVITYSASLNDNTNFVSSTLYIILINILIGLMMGLVVFTFIFEFNADVSQGPGLIFISLTTLFAKLGIIGNILAIMFFIALFFAGLTSAVSMVEPFAFYLINTYKMQRKNALILIGLIVYLLSSMCILSYYTATSDKFSFFDMSFFDILDYLASNIIMPLGGFFAAIFVGYVIKRDTIKKFLGKYLKGVYFEIWYFFLRFVSPFAVIVIMAYELFFKKMIG
ncbi:sodium- and chloride-dependent transporter, SNF family [Campylobacter sputorum subsp. bubulus]|uniref:Sodium- and chloride-dependent transporter, SNF family n=1 Tax=Campylobacter sputorum subsp. sputorum TaxID=32024 RepID=A0A381DJ13_9BACT|nr:sodium-dependent transporter [Campylobacter sputorum]ASM35698.1 Na+-dependent transporter, SNF family [Campylobacter sputorum aubsp. sputorum RM3237]KAB0582572.1 sodium-dependent transporter [Campylobacter sputorum subsp. sputorum]QEL05890.1 sodium-dependent transporter, SNF family [Campylobacter sputorum subsp. sputorum]SUX07853.1 sodium- and chloride-dependent transporter, SNF family [Campylobacter sputorum subsp. bubulus]SUX10668.1 sodium- and chloride-dependent transporter, SNF family [